MLFPYNKRILARKQRNNMSVATVIGVKEAAKRASNRKGGIGVSIQYIQKEILLKRLKADLITPPIGRPYYIIEESDFLAWEEKRGRSPGDEP
jgi:hypothetical protein